MTEAAATEAKAKKKCKFGSKCNRKNCKFAHPSADADGVKKEKSNGSTIRSDGDNGHHQGHVSSPLPLTEDASLPSEISVALDNLAQTNDSTITAIASNAVLISKLQGENAQLMNVAKGTQRDLNHLREQISDHLKENVNPQLELAAAVEQEAIAKELVQTTARNAQKLITKEKETSKSLREELKASQEELKASQDLVARLLQNNKERASMEGSETNSREQLGKSLSTTSKSGTALATTSESGILLASTGDSLSSNVDENKAKDNPDTPIVVSPGTSPLSSSADASHVMVGIDKSSGTLTASTNPLSTTFSVENHSPSSPNAAVVGDPGTVISSKSGPTLATTSGSGKVLASTNHSISSGIDVENKAEDKTDKPGTKLDGSDDPAPPSGEKGKNSGITKSWLGTLVGNTMQPSSVESDSPPDTGSCTVNGDVTVERAERQQKSNKTAPEQQRRQSESSPSSENANVAIEAENRQEKGGPAQPQPVSMSKLQGSAKAVTHDRRQGPLPLKKTCRKEQGVKASTHNHHYGLLQRQREIAATKEQQRRQDELLFMHGLPPKDEANRQAEEQERIHAEQVALERFKESQKEQRKREEAARRTEDEDRKLREKQLAEERQRQHELLRQKQEAAKMAEQEAVRIEQEEMERRRLIKLEKQEALANQQASCSVLQKQPSPDNSGAAKPASPQKPSGIDGRWTDSPESSKSLTTKPTVSKTQRARLGKMGRTRQTGTVRMLEGRRQSGPTVLLKNTRLSRYMYPNTKSMVFGVSPIFELLQDPATLGTARELLQYEAEMVEQKNELVGLEKSKKQFEAGIVEEQNLLDGFNKQINDVEKEYKSLQDKWGIFNFAGKIWETFVEEETEEPEQKEEKDYLAEAIRILEERRAGETVALQELLAEEQEASKTKKQKASAVKTEQKIAEKQGGELSRDSDVVKKLASRLEVEDEKTRQKEATQAAQRGTKADKKRTMTKREKEAKLILLGKDREKIQKRRDDMNIPARIESLQAESLQFDEPIRAKKREISQLRAKISELKGEGEDYSFDIDGSRDEQGHTFLMVAAQNNDVETASLCFDLKADPNLTSPEGFTAMLFAYVFKLNEMVTLVAKHGGRFPTQQTQVWKDVMTATVKESESAVDWDTTLRIAEQAAIPAETILESANALEVSEESRMAVLSEEERRRDFVFFDHSVAGGHMNSNNMRRVVLLNKDVYRWFGEADVASKSDFLAFLDILKPQTLRKQTDMQNVVCSRRSVVGIKRTYEVLCAPLGKGVKSPVCLFTPFVTSAVEGVADVGVLVWAITVDNKASLYKTLIESAEFLRHKVEDDERFPPHEKEVLELGKDVHLLDLQSTSIFTSKPLELYALDVDQGDLDRLDSDEFSPKKRIAYYEQQLNRAIFDASEEEARDNEAILSGERAGMSTSLFGGAGTGKTLLMTKKIVSVAAERKILVVSRLPRLISVIKGAVEEQRETGNITFSTYDDLLALLARSVTPATESDGHGFSTFSQVQYGSTSESCVESSVSFLDAFVGQFLEEKERKAMRKSLIEPMTLWTAFRTIKSSVRCSMTKESLTQKEYMKLPTTFGLRPEQRKVVYDLYLRYEEWLGFGRFKWDEADRVLFTLKYGPSVFSDHDFKSWEKRSYSLGEVELLEEDGESPLSPYFYDMVFADEAQDFTELDLALLLRMSSGVRSLFLGADPAQSVELGIRMRAGTINDVLYNSLSSCKGIHVRNVLQEIQMRTNHRTHAQNLAIATAVRRILARSFGVPESRENALINGPIPEGLTLTRRSDLADKNVFVGGNIVLLAPDEMADKLRSDLRKLGVQNDVFGVREAKGLEFNDVALIGFFSYIHELGNTREWENALRWLSSSTSLTTTESCERVQGKQLEDCDYTLTHPEILDQAMLLYTALTRARNHLYLIEIEELSDCSRRSKGRSAGVGLQDFAFRRFKDLDLLKTVKSIDEGFVEMTPAQHKARGVLLVTQAINLSRRSSGASASAVKEKFLEAADRFSVDKGNDKELLDQCLKHMEAVLLKRTLVETIERKFFDRKKGKYNLEGRFADVLSLEQNCSKFFSLCIGDSFLLDEIASIRALMEDLFVGTPFEVRFGEICNAIKQHEP